MPSSVPLSMQSLTLPSGVQLCVPLSMPPQEDEDAEDERPELRKPSKKKTNKKKENTSDREE